MRLTASIPELTKATGLTRQAVSRALKKEEVSFIWHKGVSGNEKHYTVSFLSQKYRIALAAMDATPILDKSASIDAQIGVEAAHEILVSRAEKKVRVQIAKEDRDATFEKLPDQRKKEARARFSFLQMCDSFIVAAGFKIRKHARRSKVGDKAFVVAYNSGKIQVSAEVQSIIGKKTSYSTLKRIAGAYYKLGVAGLSFNYHNPKRGSTELSDKMQEFVIGTMCQSPDTSLKNIRCALQGACGSLDINDVPSTAIISRFLNRWISENENIWLFYTNHDTWKNKEMMAYGSASAHVERLNQLWEADSTPADLMLVDGRYSIIGMIDVYSRRLRFLVSKTSRAVSVVSLIRHSLIDWGVPEIIKTDNGKDYISNHVVRVMRGLDIHQHLCTPFQGQEKPHIERAFKTFLHGLVELMPNYIGHNVADRKAIEAKRSFADRVMNKKSNPVEMSMTSKELQTFCNKWTNFIYQHNEHRGLDGKKPIDMARNWREPIRRIHNLRALDTLLMPAPKDGGMRTITKKGVRVDGRRFQSKEFASHMGKKVYVLLDPADLGQVFIYLQNNYGERTFLCPAIDPIWLGIDTAKFAVMSRKHQDKVMRQGKKKLNKLAKEQGVQEALENYVKLRKSQVENIIELPLKSEEHTTPALKEAGKAADAALELQEEKLTQDIQADDLLVLDQSHNLPPLQEDKVIDLLICKTDRYHQLRVDLKRNKRKLTKWEFSFLNDFYGTDEGRVFMSIEGDLRKKVGLIKDQAQK